MTTTIAPAVDRTLVHARRDRVAFVEVPPRRYLAVDGCERPGGQTFQNAIGTLYPIAYALHFQLKQAGVNSPVGLLEALYWVTPEGGDEAGCDDSQGPPVRDWTWRLLIPIPDEATEEGVEQAIREAAQKRTLPAMSRLHVVRWREGRSAQLLHVGPYAAEQPTIARLQQAIAEAGLEPVGPHHDIYLNDPHRVGEDKAKTILRQAVRPRPDRGAGEGD